MPKTLVVVPSRTGRLAALADAFVEGARSVRFAEVDVRRLDETDVGAAGLTGYDAIVLGAPADDEAVPAALTRLLDEAGTLVDVVGSAFVTGPTPWALLASMGTRGMILVTPTAAGGETPDDGAALAAAREQGRRVATVAGWVRHAKGHEPGHSHSHEHSHGHSHPHGHAH